jgi:hypothetical protein
MAASVVLGQRVQLRTDSYFAGKSPNPPAGTIGTVTLLDNDWVSVLWDGYTKEYNYRVTELDWYGAPPTNSGEWGWARAFQDAKNQQEGLVIYQQNNYLYEAVHVVRGLLKRPFRTPQSNAQTH